jgi:hypothetical protein
MTNRLTQIIAEMEEGDAKKVETLTGVIAIGGYLRDVAAEGSMTRKLTRWRGASSPTPWAACSAERRPPRKANRC